MKNEMRVLQKFVEEFSPLYQGQVENMSYNELFDIVGEIADAHKEGKL